MKSRCNTVYNGTAFNGFLECRNRFTLRLNIAKSINYIENALDKSSLKLNFLQKKGRKSLSPQVVEPGSPRTCIPTPVSDISKIANVCAPLLHSWESQRYAFTEFLVGNLIILIDFCLKHFLL